ncbi:hypothetical protein BGX24_011676, partial [Mortierella sp. AD032]
LPLLLFLRHCPDRHQREARVRGPDVVLHQGCYDHDRTRDAVPGDSHHRRAGAQELGAGRPNGTKQI